MNKDYVKENNQRVRDLMEQKCKNCGHLKFSHYELTLDDKKRKAGVCNEKSCDCKRFKSGG